jgi:group I intron endonuclease
MEKIVGVYKIQSKIHPERIYVGSSINIGKRWEQHLRHIPNPNGHHPKLRDHAKKYGLDDLVFSVIEQFEFISKEHLLGREQYYIDTLLPWFNTCLIANSRLGVGVSDETRDKIRKANLNKKVSDKTREKHRKAMLKRVWKAESRAKMSASMMGNKNSLGCVRSAEWCQYLSDRNNRMGLVPPSRLGVRYTEEQKRIIQEKRAKTIADRKAKISEANEANG